jgi:hypothetical protein
MYRKLGIAISLFISFLIPLTTTPTFAVETYKISSYGAGHQIWFEAEDFDERDPADDSSFALSDEPGAYGRSITCMGGTRGGNMMRYTFDISKTGGSGGTWYFWGRVINPGNRSSFMLVEGNPGDPMPVVMPMGDLANEFRVFEENAGDVGIWAWSGDNGAESHTKTLQDGENTMYIISRENQAILDVFVWTDDPDYVPTEADYENAQVPSIGAASKPSPSSNAQDVPYYTDTLSWTAGEYAVKHNIYFGTSFDDVNAATASDPRGVLIGEGQTETSSVIPDPLALATTYYWRVDEVNAPPDNSIFKGSIWNFEVEPVSYEVTGVGAAASTENDPNMIAAKTVNGAGLNAAGQHSTVMEDMWLNAMDEVSGANITYDFGAVAMLERMHVWNHNSQTEKILGYGIKEALIETSADGETWTELKTVELPQASGTASYTGDDVALDNVLARYLRITALSNYSLLGLNQVGLAEVRFYNIPVASRELSPASGTTLNALEAELSWRSGRFTAEHQVLFSDDRGAVEDGSAVIATTADRSLTVSDLSLTGEYFWQIIDVTADGTPYPGPIQNLTVAGSLPIDDMEMYKAEEGLFIWEHWIDGFENNDNGSVVGNGDEAEKTVVFEGSQSLPMAYDNTAAPVSEATRFFDTAVDLTAGQADNLRLHVRGDAPGFLDGGDTLTVGAAGADIWGTVDDFRFVHKKLSGDGSITARIDSCSQADVCTKAGVMMRANTGDDATNAFSFITPTGRVGTQWRTETFIDTVSTRSETEGEITLPYWVRLTRTGNMFKGEQSADGVTWQPMFQSGSPDLPTEREIVTIPDIHIGLAVTSHLSGASAVAVFSEVTTTGNVTGAWTSEAIGADTHPDNDAAPVYLRLADTAGREKTFDHPNPAATVMMDWDTWEIPLEDMSPVDPAKLDSITLGVGKSGVSGKVYVDYISTSRPYPERIVWVSFHGADDAPSGPAADVGFTEASDKAYTDLLKAQGYTVTRYITNGSPDAEILNSAALVIIGRAVSSGHYSNDAATLWNSISAPMMITGGYVLRNSRMGFTTGTTMVDTTGDITLTVNDPEHPIFAGVELVDGTMVNPFAGAGILLPTDGVTASRGISVNNDPADDQGVVLAVISEASADTGPAGGLMIAEWAAGATLEHAGGAGADVLAGDRLVFLTGSREPAGVTGGDAAGLYDLYDDGTLMFLNAVSYMLGE